MMVNELVNTCQGEILASCFLTPRFVQQSPYCSLLAMVASQDNDTCLDPCQCAVFRTRACFLKCQYTESTRIGKNFSPYYETGGGFVTAGTVWIMTSRNLIGS